MKSLVYSLLTAACLMIASSTGASAQSRSIEHDLPPFEGLEVSDGFKITLSKGDSYSAKLTMDDALESYVQCYVKAGVLHIGIDSKKNGYRKVSLLWRLFRYEDDPDKGFSLDILFLPICRP